MIEEKFYDSPMDSDKLIALVECVEDKMAEDITPQYVDFFSAFRSRKTSDTKIFCFSCSQIIREMAEYLYLHESGRGKRDKEAG